MRHQKQKNTINAFSWVGKQIFCYNDILESMEEENFDVK